MDRPAMPAADRFRVLLVEDNDDDAALVIQYVHDLGDDEFAVERATTLAAARAAMASRTHDVVLLDLQLPDSPDSLATIRAVCAEHRDGSPIVVILTGLSDDQVVQAALKDCAQNYLVKNEIAAQPQAMLRAIRVAVERHGRERLDAIRHRAAPRPPVYDRIPPQSREAEAVDNEREAFQILRRVNRVTGSVGEVAEPGDLTTAIRAVEVALGSLQQRIDDMAATQREIRADVAQLGVWARRVDDQNNRRDADQARTHALVEAGRRRLASVSRSVDGSRRRKDPGLLGRVDTLEQDRQEHREQAKGRREDLREIVRPVLANGLTWLGAAIASLLAWAVAQKFGGK